MDGAIASGTPKLGWGGAPSHVRSAIETMVGASVVDAISMPGGFNPGIASRLRLADGSSVFVKSVSEELNRASARMHRREAVVVDTLQRYDEVPDLLGVLDDGGWVTLVFEDVAGRHPSLPWRHDDLERILRVQHDMARQLTPAPLEADPLAAANEEFDCWANLAQDPDLLVNLNLSWATDRLAELLELQERWSGAVEGDTLLHGDLRADQVLFAEERTVFVDWPHVRTGPSWADIVMLAPSVALQGGPSPEQLIAMSPTSRGWPEDDLLAFGTAAAGGLLWYSTQPPPPGLPTVREFQRAQGRVLLEWIGRARNWIDGPT